MSETADKPKIMQVRITPAQLREILAGYFTNEGAKYADIAKNQGNCRCDSHRQMSESHAAIAAVLVTLSIALREGREIDLARLASVWADAAEFPEFISDERSGGNL